MGDVDADLCLYADFFVNDRSELIRSAISDYEDSLTRLGNGTSPLRMVLSPELAMGKQQGCPKFINTVGVLARFPLQPSNLQYVYQIEVLNEDGVSVKAGTTCDIPDAFARHKKTHGNSLESLTIMSDPMPRAQALESETFLRSEAQFAGRHTLNKRLVTLAEMKGGAGFHQVVEGSFGGRIKLFPRGILLNR
jgi:hypothetical protein